MTSTVLKPKGFYGWIALAGAMTIFFCYAGILYYGYGVFLPSLIKEFGWSRAALSGAQSAFIIVAGLLGPLVGTSVVKFGVRKNIIAGNLLAVLGLAAMYLTSKIWHVYLFYGVLAAIGDGFGITIVTMSIANNWFVKRRALAISLIMAAGGVGGLVFPPLITGLISSLGWRLAWVCVAAMHLVLAVGVGGILVRNKPEDIGQVPDGTVSEVVRGTVQREMTPSRVYQTPVDWKTGDALRTPALWLITMFGTLHMFSVNTLSTHQVSYIRSLGFSAMTSATVLSLVVGISIVGRLVIGALGTRFEGRHLTVACLAVFAISLIILMNVKTLPILYLYTVVAGLGFGGPLVLRSSMVGAYYGRAYYAQIMGYLSPFMLISAAGPLFAGLIYDSTGSYRMAFMIAIILLGVALVCALLARPPKLQLKGGSQ